MENTIKISDEQREWLRNTIEQLEEEERNKSNIVDVEDRFGNVIREWDILREHPNNHIGIVEKDKGNFIIEWDNPGYPDWSWSEMAYDYSDRIEIIGNIHKNPELFGV